MVSVWGILGVITIGGLGAIWCALLLSDGSFRERGVHRCGYVDFVGYHPKIKQVCRNCGGVEGWKPVIGKRNGYLMWVDVEGKVISYDQA